MEKLKYVPSTYDFYGEIEENYPRIVKLWRNWKSFPRVVIKYSSWKILLDPVVQSVVSLTSSLRVILVAVLMDLICNILIFFAEKMWVAFALQKLLTFFQQKIAAYLCITQCKF